MLSSYSAGKMSNNDNVMKIMVATDNHIGYMEKDPVRCNDSLETFEEILRIAQEQEVDFILLGGDLFHENKPSRQVLHKTMEMMRHYCMGSRPCPIEFRSDQAVNFQHSKFPVVNYEDPNYNVSIPVFTIHGNHDDPAGDGNLSAVDILSVANLVSYFGKAANIESIEVSPLLMQKGTAKLALYGLGSCRDERLHRMFKRGKVNFLRPSEEEGEWFSVLVFHQNRARHGATNYIPENFIPSFFDLVIWGHEHECLIDPKFVRTSYDAEGEEKGMYISQPGSSIATSLSDGELAKKHVGILYIKDCTFKIDPIPLQTVRPFIVDSVTLSKTKIPPQEEDQVAVYLTEKVQQLIDRAVSESEGSTKLPLVRLKVDYSGGYTTFSLARFGQKFVDQVANPRNILNWYRHRDPTTLSKKEDSGEDYIFSADLQTLDSSNLASLLVEQLKAEQLSLLSEKNLGEALTEFVDKEEREAVPNFVKYSMQQSRSFLKERPINEAKIDEQISQQRDELCKRQEASAEDARDSLRESRLSQPDRPGAFDDHDSSDSDHSTRAVEGRGRGRGGRGKRGRGSTSSSSGTGTGTRGGSGRGRGRGRPKKAAAPAPSSSGASPLTFSSSGATTTTTAKSKKTSSTSRHTGKRPVIYEEDSDSGEVEVMEFTTSRKRTSSSQKTSASTCASECVDLTQSDSDDDPFEPFSSSSAAPRAKRRKH